MILSGSQGSMRKAAQTAGVQRDEVVSPVSICVFCFGGRGVYRIGSILTPKELMQYARTGVCLSSTLQDLPTSPFQAG